MPPKKWEGWPGVTFARRQSILATNREVTLFFLMCADKVMRQMSFSIERMEFRGKGLALIVGRCCGDTIKMGDQAQAMVHQSFNDRGEPTIIASEPISIAMPEFLVFEDKQDTLHSGMTGGFLLSVELATGLRLGWFLQGANS